MFIGNKYREPQSSRIYVSTRKDIPLGAKDKEQAYWVLAGWLPEFGMTIADIYHDVLGPKGLTLDDTRALVKGAVDSGYLR